MDTLISNHLTRRDSIQTASPGLNAQEATAVRARVPLIDLIHQISLSHTVSGGGVDLDAARAGSFSTAVGLSPKSARHSAFASSASRNLLASDNSRRTLQSLCEDDPEELCTVAGKTQGESDGKDGGAGKYDSASPCTVAKTLPVSPMSLSPRSDDATTMPPTNPMPDPQGADAAQTSSTSPSQETMRSPPSALSRQVCQVTSTR